MTIANVRLGKLDREFVLSGGFRHLLRCAHAEGLLDRLLLSEDISLPIQARQSTAVEGAPDAIVAEVASMLSEWEDSGELTTAFARRVVATVFRLQREIR